MTHTLKYFRKRRRYRRDIHITKDTADSDNELCRYQTYQAANFKNTELTYDIRKRTLQMPNYRITNLSYTELIRYQTCQIPNFPDTELQILNLSDTELSRYRTNQKPKALSLQFFMSGKRFISSPFKFSVAINAPLLHLYDFPQGLKADLSLHWRP